ncbi:hypothetical protein BC826DRAFT_249789 [Russula brevipes]|nr:hypothetical protein BC826DRAFT_249789 [Russula brevipes]
MDIHVGNAMKSGLFSELGFQVRAFAPGSVSFHEEKECQKDGTLSTKRAKPCLTLTVSPATSPMAAAPRYSKFFNGALSSTCFPARYPPPPGESHTPPQRAFVTSFARAATHHTEKPLASYGTDTLPFTSLFGQMSLSNPSLEVGTRTQKSPKGRPRNPKSSKTDPLPPLLSPIIVDASRPSCETQPTAKSTPVARRRRIAPLPNRHNKSAASSLSSNIPSSATSDPLFSVTSRIPSTQESVVGKSPLGHGNALSMVFFPHSTPPAQVAAEISSPPSPKSVMLTRKLISVPRPARPKPQGTTSAERMVPPPTLQGWNVSSHPVSRTPSLVSDNSSGIESASSSDELDTPPSSPPSSSHALSVRGTMTDGTSISSKPTGSKLPPMLSLKDGTLPHQMEQSMHIDLTKVVSGQEPPFTFTFGS